MPINIDNLSKPNDWICPGFMYGDNLLDSNLLKALDEFDYGLCTQIKSLKRNSIFADKTSTDPSSKALLSTLDELVVQLREFEVLEKLINKSFEVRTIRDIPLDKFWANGINSIKRLYSSMAVMLIEDSYGFSMAPHVDHKEIIANIQIYLDPDGYDVGTIFHDVADWNKTMTVPFKKNSGYFCMNTDNAVHSIKNNYDIKRRSLIIGWTI